MTGEAEPLGGLIDSLGVTHHPREGELYQGALVLLKVIEADGRVGFRQATEGPSWIERLGMLRAAEKIASDVHFEGDDD